MSNPFNVGGTFRNRIGEYEVVSIEKDHMVIRYRDGNTQEVPIDLQTRIWNNMVMESEVEDESNAKNRPSATATTPSRIEKFGKKFRGLVEDDFCDLVDGTTWRARTHLGGLLAKTLSHLSGKDFESHAIYRRPEVHVVQPHSFNAGNRLRKAKFVFRLEQNRVIHAFYVEKNFGEMDDSWDWLRFADSLETTPQAWTGLADLFVKHDLEWVAEVRDQNHEHELAVKVLVEGSTLKMCDDQGRDYAFSGWSDFVTFLRGIDVDRWCNLYLQKKISKESAIADGVRIAEKVAKVWIDLIPLYFMSVHRS